LAAMGHEACISWLRFIRDVQLPRSTCRVCACEGYCGRGPSEPACTSYFCQTHTHRLVWVLELWMRRTMDYRNKRVWARERSLSKASGLCRHRSEEHTSELQSRGHLVCRLLLEKKKKILIIRVCQVKNIKDK